MLQPKYPLMGPVEINTDIVEKVCFSFSATHGRIHTSNTQKKKELENYRYNFKTLKIPLKSRVPQD